MTTRRPGDRDRQGECRASASAEGGAPFAAAGAAEVFTGVAGLLRGPHYLADEGQWALGAFVAVLNAPWPDAQVVVAGSHRGAPAAQ